MVRQAKEKVVALVDVSIVRGKVIRVSIDSDLPGSERRKLRYQTG